MVTAVILPGEGPDYSSAEQRSLGELFDERPATRTWVRDVRRLGRNQTPASPPAKLPATIQNESQNFQCCVTDVTAAGIQNHCTGATIIYRRTSAL
jgi:hypothetical protein